MMKKIEVLPPTIVDGVPIPRKVAYVEDVGGDGCGCITAIAIVAFVAFVVGLAAIFGSGCAPRYTVVPADREVVPIRATVPDAAARRRTYVEDEAAATGWYVPDAVMLELLEAD